MSSGRVHKGDSLIVAAGAGALTGVVVGPAEGVCVALGALLGIIASPDLDILESRLSTGKRIVYMAIWPIVLLLLYVVW